jgi:hypothetical protein
MLDGQGQSKETLSKQKKVLEEKKRKTLDIDIIQYPPKNYMSGVCITASDTSFIVSQDIYVVTSEAIQTCKDLINVT